MPEEGLRETAARALSSAPDIASLRAAISVWAPRFHDYLSEDLCAGARPELGIDMAHMPGRGALASPRGDSFFVGLGRVGNRRERRFTFAHELGHALLSATDRQTLKLDESTEEGLCELFARRALAPPALVREHLRQAGMPADLAGIDCLANRFRISLRASLVVLNEVIPPDWPVAFAAASWRPHPRGDRVMGMRIDVSAADEQRFFLPIHCRLGTLGYRSLEAWSLEGELGVESSGRDACVELRSWKSGISGWVGESGWEARRHLAPASRADADERGVLCKLEVGGLKARRASQFTRRRRGARALAPVVKLPGQLDL